MAPIVFDVTEHLTPGPHRIDLSIEDIRPTGDSGYGCGRTSAYVVGWRD